MAGIVLKVKRAAGLLSLISMLVSSVAACACSHHSSSKAEAKQSCHSHSESAAEQNGAPVVSEHQSVSGTGCSCTQASPRLVFKQDQKQLQIIPAIAESPLTAPEFVAISAEPASGNFSSESFSQSFLRDSTQGRAPPRPKFA